MRVYFVKNRGNPHFRIELPEGTTLWSATVNNSTVVPVKDGNANLIPLPQHADPNAVQTLDLKLASRSRTPQRVSAVAPIISAPVLLAGMEIGARHRTAIGLSRRFAYSPQEDRPMPRDLQGWRDVWRERRPGKLSCNCSLRWC
jgi:hypothetical protein